MKALTQLTLVVLLAYGAYSQSTTDISPNKSNFLNMIRNKANLFSHNFAAPTSIPVKTTATEKTPLEINPFSLAVSDESLVEQPGNLVPINQENIRNKLKERLSFQQAKLTEQLISKEKLKKELDNARQEKEQLQENLDLNLIEDEDVRIQELERENEIQLEKTEQELEEPIVSKKLLPKVQSICEARKPCQNNGDCVDLGVGGYECKCPWGFTGYNCERNFSPQSNACSSNPCPENKICKASENSFQCVCPADRVGANCEIFNDICVANPCLNRGVCEPRETGSYVCTCEKPWTGKNCEMVWKNPCTEESLKNTEITQFKDPWNERNYIICTDISIYHSMPCTTGTHFNELYGHCVRVGYEPVVCPRNYCKNDAECLIDEDEKFQCVCKPGFTGEFCEKNINECAVGGGNEACAGGKCVDQFNGFFCECSNGIGLNCVQTIPNPCTLEAISSGREFFEIPTNEGNTYLQCTSESNFVVSKCSESLYWHQEMKACVLEKPMAKIGACLNYPCENGGECQANGTDFTCLCREGFTGKVCETMVNSCESNPCQNGGKCLPFAGGYTCSCPDKIIDECCCHGVKNPCPTRSLIIPGVNNYFPHLFANRYFHCDFDGRAFSRKCSEGLRWTQSSLSCLPYSETDPFSQEPMHRQAETNRKGMLEQQTKSENKMEALNKEINMKKIELKERKKNIMEKQKIKTLRMLRPLNFRFHS